MAENLSKRMMAPESFGSMTGRQSSHSESDGTVLPDSSVPDGVPKFGSLSPSSASVASSSIQPHPRSEERGGISPDFPSPHGNPKSELESSLLAKLESLRMTHRELQLTLEKATAESVSVNNTRNRMNDSSTHKVANMNKDEVNVLSGYVFQLSEQLFEVSSKMQAQSARVTTLSDKISTLAKGFTNFQFTDKKEELSSELEGIGKKLAEIYKKMDSVRASTRNSTLLVEATEVRTTISVSTDTNDDLVPENAGGSGDGSDSTDENDAVMPMEDVSSSQGPRKTVSKKKRMILNSPRASIASSVPPARRRIFTRAAKVIARQKLSPQYVRELYRRKAAERWCSKKKAKAKKSSPGSSNNGNAKRRRSARLRRRRQMRYYYF